jgi:hypothetical protein
VKKKMANITAKTSSNVFYRARCVAAKHNDQLSSREGASGLMSIDRGRLYRIEKGGVIPYPEEILLMADLYGAPELENHYCTEMCPLGYGMQKVAVEDLDRISVRALAAFRRMDQTAGMFLDIMEDGVVTEEEKPVLESVLAHLEELEAITQGLKLWVKKNL